MLSVGEKLESREAAEEYNKKSRELQMEHHCCIGTLACTNCFSLVSDSICLCAGVFECPECGHENREDTNWTIWTGQANADITLPYIPATTLADAILDSNEQPDESDREFLMWIHERLEHVHGESPLNDYMHKLRAIIAETPKDVKTFSVGQGRNSLEELRRYL